jgi:hypothetical protein
MERAGFSPHRSAPVHYPYYNDDSSRVLDKDLECGDLSPLWLLGRLAGQAEPRSAARRNAAPLLLRRRQIACQKRRQVGALQSLAVAALPRLVNPCASVVNCFGVSLHRYPV